MWGSHLARSLSTGYKAREKGAEIGKWRRGQERGGEERRGRNWRGSVRISICNTRVETFFYLFLYFTII
jgi:hypothetical protein